MQIINRAVQIVVLSIKQLKDPYYQGFVGQIAFGFMMSIIPLLILISYVLAVFEISTDTLYDLAGEYLTGGAAEYMMGLVTNTGGTGGLTVVLIIVALYGASKAHYSLACIANHMSTVGDNANMVLERIRAIWNTVITIVTIAAALVLLVYGEVIFNIVVHIIFSNSLVEGIGAAQIAQSIEEVMTSTVAKLLLWLRWPIMLCLFAIVFGFNFYVLPKKRTKFRYALPGGAFTGLGILIVSRLFSIYANSITSYNLIYGSAAALVVMMVWFYLISWVMVLGLVLNEVLSELRGTGKNAVYLAE